MNEHDDALQMLAVQAGIPYDAVKHLAERRQLYMVVKLANTTEGRERRKAEVRRRERLNRQYVARSRDGAGLPGRVAVAICLDMQQQTLDTTTCGA
ncbi:hypothetical protein BH09ACT8_BH09ACT8_59110 [soil metagenome]